MEEVLDEDDLPRNMAPTQKSQIIELSDGSDDDDEEEPKDPEDPEESAEPELGELLQYGVPHLAQRMHRTTVEGMELTYLHILQVYTFYRQKCGLERNENDCGVREPVVGST